ncbi:cellulose biosynthesis protein BcsS [Methylobacterium sp. J-072]|uniref:cellulose biosynthesis protein BcsS n=1 Tax=Methylobacterium sp. J-072 TaxID=2836651 RepID=UPI003918A9AF
MPDREHAPPGDRRPGLDAQLWTRLAWGYRGWDTYLGPELSVYGDETGYRKWNLGLHATDFAIARYSFRVSGGLQTESGRRRASPYVALAVWSPW